MAIKMNEIVHYTLIWKDDKNMFAKLESRLKNDMYKVLWDMYQNSMIL